MIAKLIKPLIAALLVLYFFFLVIARTPATVGAWALHNAIPNLWITGVTGTLWDGSASGAQIDLGKTSIPLGQLDWKLSPWSILALAPCVSFSTVYTGQSADGHLCQSISGTTRVKNTSVDGSLAVVNELLPDVKIDGHASLQVAKAEFSGAKINKLEAQLSWQNAAVNAIDKWMNFGSFAAKLNENGRGGIKAKIFDIEGPYKVDFNGDWMVQSGWKVEGFVTPGEGSSPEVKEGLSAFGEEVETGKFKLVWP